MIDVKKNDVSIQNFEVCIRMLIHDLIDASKNNKEIERLCNFYTLSYLENGGFTIALPRLYLLNPKFEYIQPKKNLTMKSKKKPKKKPKGY